MWLKKVKKTASWTYVLSDLNGEEHLMKKNGKKQIKKNLELKKLSRDKVVNYMLNGKATIVLLTAQLEKKAWYKSGTYPSSFTNVRFWTKIAFLNVVKCRWGSQGAVSTATVS